MARQRRQLDLSLSGAKVTNEYGYTSIISHDCHGVHREKFACTFSHRIMFMIQILSALYGIRIEGNVVSALSQDICI